MLFVRVKVGPSTIPGIGLGCFAAERIPRGTLFSRWTPGFDVALTDEQIANLPAPEREALEHFGWHAPDGMCHISLGLCRFVNHSKAQANLVEGEDGGAYAARDIEVDDEIFEDYEAFDPDFAEYAKEMRE